MRRIDVNLDCWCGREASWNDREGVGVSAYSGSVTYLANGYGNGCFIKVSSASLDSSSLQDCGWK